jgi:hypothetical protein
MIFFKIKLTRLHKETFYINPFFRDSFQIFLRFKKESELNFVDRQLIPSAILLQNRGQESLRKNKGRKPVS